MLSRLKTASPKLKFFLGLWLAVEILSLPAAAAFAWAFGMPSIGHASDSQLVAERLETDIPGVTHFVVTHTNAFDIAVGGTSNVVEVTVEDAHQLTSTVSGCGLMSDALPRVIKTVNAPSHPEKRFGTLFVTITHDVEFRPDIRFESNANLPDAAPCQLS